MTIPRVENPGRYHEVTEAEGRHHVRPTKSFAARYDMTRLLLILATCLLPWMAFFMLPGVTLVATVALAVGWLVYRLLPPYDLAPLVVSPGGRIEYRGREIRATEAVTAVRVFRRTHGADDSDTYHVELLSATGAVELPGPDFGAAEDVREVAVLAAWLAQVFAAPLDETIGEGRTSQAG